MEQMRDIPTSILLTEGSEVKTGVLSILERRGFKMLKSSEYKLNPLYWQLVSYAGQTFLLGYPCQLGGAKATKKLSVLGCSIEMNLPKKVVVSQHSKETFLCIQCGEKIIFLKAENKRQRNKWVDAIRSATTEPTCYPSMASTTSLISSESFDVVRDHDQLLPRSVHDTADTPPHPGAGWRRVTTSPAGRFQMTNRASVLSIPSNAHALAYRKRRTLEMASAREVQSQQLGIDSLNTADRMRSPFQRDLNRLAIYDGDDDTVEPVSLSTSPSTSQLDVRVQYPVRGKRYTKKSRYRHPGSETKASHQAGNSYYVNYESAYEPIKSDDKESYPILPFRSPPDMPYEKVYMNPQDYDDQSSMSRVNDLDLESIGLSNSPLSDHEKTDAPKVPKRDYSTSVRQDGLVKKKSSKKTRAPQPPETPKDQMDSIQREKTVCLETQFRGEDQPIGRDESNDGNEKEMRWKMNSGAPNGESFYDYIQRFRSELFRINGFIVEVDKTDLSPTTMKLVCVADWICIAGLPNAKLHSLLHVDDVIVNVNRQMVLSIDFCYTLFRTTVENKVQLHVKRVMHGVLCHVSLPVNGDVDSLGLEFGNQNQGNEVTAMHSDGLVAKSGSPSRPKTLGVVNGGRLVNWGLVEINQKPVSFDSSPADVRNQIQRAGIELALVFIPMDLINIFKEGPCGESTDQTCDCADGRQRNEWEYAIHSALSTVSKTSTHSSDYYEVFSPGVVPEPPRRVRNTPYTAPRPKAVWKGAQTNSAGRLQMANRAYRSSIPASAQALAQQNQRSQEMASPKVLQSQQLDNHSLNSAEGMRSSSLREPNKSAIFDDSAKHVGLEVVEDNKHFEVSPSNPLVLSTSTGTNQPNLRVQDPVPRTLYTQKSRYTHSGTETKALHQAENSCDIIEPSYEQIEKDPIMPHPSPPEMPVENRTRYDYDSESCVSRMNNLGLESEGNANDFLFDDTTAPGPPKQDYQNPTSVVQEGLAKRKSCKKTRAPKPPEGPVDPINSIQRRNPVCLETQFHQPKGRDKSDDDNEKEMRGKMNGEATNDESIHEYIQGTTEADLPEKAQSDGTDSVEPLDHDLDGRSATGNFGALGGKLSTKSHGLTLSIPPGALEEGEKISLIVLTDIPEGLTLNTDELLVSHGFQCYPSGLRFKKPAKLIIPHCALVTTPNNIKTILYSWNQSGTPKRLSDPDNIICSVQERWLEVSITHFSGGFIALIRDWLFLKGILLSCMSFLPRFMPPSRRPVLEVRFVKKPHNQKWKDVHTLDDPGFRPVKGDDDEIILQKGTLRVTCQLGEKGPKSDVPTIQDSNMMLETKVTGYIMLDLTEKSDDTLVTLEVVHTSTQTIKFNTRFQGIGERFKEQDTPSPSNVEIPSDEQIVTDANILNLARLLPPNLWSPLYVALHIDHSIAEGIREKYTEIPEQYIHLLQKWRAALTRTRTDLNAILIQVEAGGLVNKYVD